MLGKESPPSHSIDPLPGPTQQSCWKGIQTKINVTLLSPEELAPWPEAGSLTLTWSCSIKKRPSQNLCHSLARKDNCVQAKPEIKSQTWCSKTTDHQAQG